MMKITITSYSILGSFVLWLLFVSLVIERPLMYELTFYIWSIIFRNIIESLTSFILKMYSFWSNESGYNENFLSKLLKF